MMIQSTTRIIPNRSSAVTRSALLALMLLAASLGLAPAPIYRADRDPNRVAMKALEGEWYLRSFRVAENVIADGENMAADGMTTCVIGEGRMKIQPGGCLLDITLDATKEPKHFDFTMVELKWLHKGIYHLKGNVLTVHFYFHKDGRPTDSQGANGEMILERKRR